MVDEITYCYAKGALLDTPHSYQYSKFFGSDFLVNWVETLRSVQFEVDELVSPPAPRFVEEKQLGEHFATEDFLENIYLKLHWDNVQKKEIWYFLSSLVGKFEVRKRIHARYNSCLMPDDGDDYRNLSLYLRMAEVFDKAYGMTYDLQYLNVLLKLSDILIAYKETLAEREKGRLGWLIERLLGHVRACAQNIGVSLCI